MKYFCAKCKPKKYIIKGYTFGKCDKCGYTTGVSVCEPNYDMPEGFQELFGDLTTPGK